GNRGGASLADLGRDSLGFLQIEVGRLEGELRAISLDQDIGQDRDRVTPLDDTVDVAERLQQGCAFDGDFHANPASRTSFKGDESGVSAENSPEVKRSVGWDR